MTAPAGKTSCICHQTQAGKSVDGYLPFPILPHLVDSKQEVYGCKEAPKETQQLLHISLLPGAFSFQLLNNLRRGAQV